MFFVFLGVSERRNFFDFEVYIFLWIVCEEVGWYINWRSICWKIIGKEGMVFLEFFLWFCIEISEERKEVLSRV